MKDYNNIGNLNHAGDKPCRFEQCHINALFFGSTQCSRVEKSPGAACVEWD